MPWRWPSQAIWLTGLLLGLAVLLRVADPEPVARLRLSVFDSYLRAAPRVADPAMPVKIVDVDADSLTRIGQWPWPRTRLAEIVTKLQAAGAATISFDLILAEPDRLSPGELLKVVASRPDLAAVAAEAAKLPSNDALLAQAIADRPVVLGFVGETTSRAAPAKPRASFATAGDDPRQFVPAFPGATASLPELAAAAPGSGSVNWLPSQDLVVRRVPTLVTVADTLYPSLALETLRLAQGASTLQIKSSGASGLLAFGQQTGVEFVKAGSVILPTAAGGELWLNFAPHDAKRYIPAHAVIEGSVPASEIAGRHIFIGSSAPGLLDLRATPLHASLPGVEIHAQALEQMLSGAHLYRPSYATGAELLFLVLAAAAVAYLLRKVGPVLAAVAGAASIVAVVVTSWLAFKTAGLLFDPVYPAIVLVGLYLATSLSTYIKAEMDRAFVRQAFGHYVAPQLVEQLADNAGNLKLGGETREITLLFSDVRGFSRRSEDLDAEGLIRFINELFTPLSDVILEEHGTIDKFMGDAVMAFWNAPVRSPDHARQACRAALRMLGALDELNRGWAARASQSDVPFQPVRIGIGLNTGPCVVGNVGSPQRFDYSILGDVVNVASRLEGETKSFGVPIIAGEATVAAAPDFAFLEIGTLPLRGMDRPAHVFALIGDEKLAASAQFTDLKSAHAELRAAVASGTGSQIDAKLAACRDLLPARLAEPFERYAAQLLSRSERAASGSA